MLASFLQLSCHSGALHDFCMIVLLTGQFLPANRGEHASPQLKAF